MTVGTEAPAILEFWPGLCECGCGTVTPIAKRTKKDRAQVRGVSLRFINGHNMRLARSPEHVENAAAAKRGRVCPQMREEGNPAWRGASATANAIHLWLRKYYPKSGICEGCGTDSRRTFYAYRNHPKGYTRNREDYLELCGSCHKKFDVQTAKDLRAEMLGATQDLLDSLPETEATARVRSALLLVTEWERKEPR